MKVITTDDQENYDYSELHEFLDDILEQDTNDDFDDTDDSFGF